MKKLPIMLTIALVGIISFSISASASDSSVPQWVKNNAKWWSTDVIPDSEFIDGLEDLITKGIIRVSPSEKTDFEEKNIPDWIKTTAKWWSDDQISNNDFLLSIEYLIKKGIIRI